MIESFINDFKRYGKEIIEKTFLEGHCYDFAVILKKHFKEGRIFHSDLDGHYIFSYKDDFYDIRGKITDQINKDDYQPIFESQKSIKPKWIVNDIGELGVEIKGRCFFLYKGDNIEYNGKHDDGSPMMYRLVGKREFGEVCHPQTFYKDGYNFKERYDVALTPGIGVTDVDIEKYVWRPIAKEKKGLSIYLDDVRNPPAMLNDNFVDWKVIRTASNCIDFIDKHLNEIDFISFDHDLGNDEDGTGYNVACHLEKLAIEKKIYKPFDYQVHSANPVDADKINVCMKNVMSRLL